ncbi:hypothetical protein L1987_44876 [Smallanthus sonchifolius]|uniref:Uncharacterized protein n=1 Tax=Smallanthus sonchifolius TaxID=185202 RepID=A0ACB9GRB1_9ASTR|nr:hypothetical protein L1987_44876 [Smallanthus sonchifolius]
MAKYYDIDDILADEELVPAVFLEAVNGVGLFESNDTNRVEPRSKVELPFWLASELHLRQAASVSIPPCFNKKTREEIGADGAHVDLRSRCLNFYELGCKIVQFHQPQHLRPGDFKKLQFWVERGNRLGSNLSLGEPSAASFPLLVWFTGLRNPV